MLETSQFSLVGTKHQQDILLKGQHQETPFDTILLTLNQTFYPPQMYLIEALSDRQVALFKDILSVGIVRHYDNPEKNKDAREQMKIVLKDALSKNPLPKRIVAKLLTNDKHWQLVMIDLEKGMENPEIYVINTTNMTKSYSLSGIQTEYFNKLGFVLNEIYEELACEKRFSSDSLRYIQGLQYGNMSCGITSDINYQKIVTLPHDELKKLVFQPNDIVRHEVHSQIKIEEETFDEVSYEFDAGKSIDRSIRCTPLEDGARRVEIYRDLCRRASLKNELENRLPCLLPH